MNPMNHVICVIQLWNTNVFTIYYPPCDMCLLTYRSWHIDHQYLLKTQRSTVQYCENVGWLKRRPSCCQQSELDDLNCNLARQSCQCPWSSCTDIWPWGQQEMARPEWKPLCVMKVITQTLWRRGTSDHMTDLH